MNSNLRNLLTQKITEILRQGLNLLDQIDNRLYSQAFSDGGAIGGHFRHCLEFINSFLSGIENRRVDYDKRERNRLFETEREFAMAEILRTISALENLSEKAILLLVKPEDYHGENDFWCESSIERELEFLQSHTIHHYALIAFKLRALGFQVPAEFGVAPSTLRFWQQEKAAKV